MVLAHHEDGGVYAIDLGGSRLDGEVMRRRDPVLLCTGAVFHLGEAAALELLGRVPEPAEAPSQAQREEEASGTDEETRRHTELNRCAGRSSRKRAHVSPHALSPEDLDEKPVVGLEPPLSPPRKRQRQSSSYYCRRVFFQ